MRNYKIGSRSLGHEPRATVSGLSWLGLKSSDILRRSSQSPGAIYTLCSPISYSSELLNENSPLSYRMDSLPEPAGLPEPAEAFSPLTDDDRCKATNILYDMMCGGNQSTDDLDIIHELHIMLMLNLKAEIQAVDDVGCIADWLDGRLREGAEPSTWGNNTA